MSIETYFSNLPTDIQDRMWFIRQIGQKRLPEASEKLSYGMPSFFAPKLVFHYGAFKTHIGIFPPLKAPDELLERVKPYANEKGNLAFVHKNAFPTALIEEVIAAHILRAKL